MAKIAIGTANAIAKNDRWRTGAHACPALDRVSNRVAMAAPAIAITMIVVFIDTANAQPIINPAMALRDFQSLMRTAIAASQKSSQRSSVRYSSEPRKNVGKSAANTADHAAVVASNRRRAIIQTN